MIKKLLRSLLLKILCSEEVFVIPGHIDGKGDSRSVRSGIIRDYDGDWITNNDAYAAWGITGAPRPAISQAGNGTTRLFSQEGLVIFSQRNSDNCRYAVKIEDVVSDRTIFSVFQIADYVTIGEVDRKPNFDIPETYLQINGNMSIDGFIVFKDTVTKKTNKIQLTNGLLIATGIDK